MKLTKIKLLPLLALLFCSLFFSATAYTGDERIKIYAWRCELCNLIVYTLTPYGPYFKGPPESGSPLFKQQSNVLHHYTGKSISPCSRSSKAMGNNAHYLTRYAQNSMTPYDMMKEQRIRENLYVIKD